MRGVTRLAALLVAVLSAVVALTGPASASAGATGPAASGTSASGTSASGTSAEAVVGPFAGDVRMQSLYDWRCVDVFGGGAGPWVQLWTCNGQANQTFFRVHYPDGTDEIRTSDYWCVDGRWGEGSSLERAPCTGHIGQRWQLHPNQLTGGFIVKSMQYPNLVWDVFDHGRGTKIQLWDYNGGLNQNWKFAAA